MHSVEGEGGFKGFSYVSRSAQQINKHWNILLKHGIKSGSTNIQVINKGSFGAVIFMCKVSFKQMGAFDKNDAKMEFFERVQLRLLSVCMATFNDHHRECCCKHTMEAKIQLERWMKRTQLGFSSLAWLACCRSNPANEGTWTRIPLLNTFNRKVHSSCCGYDQGNKLLKPTFMVCRCFRRAKQPTNPPRECKKLYFSGAN